MSSIESQMRELFSRWAKSKLSLRAFGEQEKVSYSKLMYWRKRLREGPPSSPVDRPDLVSVRVISPPAEEPKGYVLRLTDGRELQIPRGVDESDLTRLLRALSSC